MYGQHSPEERVAWMVPCGSLPVLLSAHRNSVLVVTKATVNGKFGDLSYEEAHRSALRMKHYAWQVRRRAAVLLILLLPLYAVGAPNANRLWTKCIRSVPRSFTPAQQEQLCTGKHIRQNPTAPGQCAKLALGGRPLQAAKFASRIELLRGVSIIQLCSGAHSTGPAKCWLAIPGQERQQMLVSTSNDELALEATAAAIPLVQICRNAQDDRPAKCLRVWFEMSKTVSRRDAHDTHETATAICSTFGGHETALKQCVKQAQPNLRFGGSSQIGTLQLCRFIGDGTNLSNVVKCASMLGKKRVPPSTIAEVCAEASAEATFNRQPHTCFLEAQQKLRWMDQDAHISLCKDAVASAEIVPIDCALEMKIQARTLLPSNPSYTPTAEFGLLVANLCRGATNATTVIECVRLLPVRAFTADQVLRLCAASTMPVEDVGDGGSVSLYPTSCAMKARLLLQRAVSLDGSNGMDMTASAAAVKVCEQSMSDAPSKCLTDTQHDQTLSAKLRVQLCQLATSDAPYLCVKSLRRFVNSKRLDTDDAVAACSHTESLGPAECITEFLRVATSTTGTNAAQLCRGSRNVEPARCFRASPQFYDDELKVSLCNQAESTAPASCVETVITRIGYQPSAKVALCRGATTSAPAACAIEAPFGMDEANVIFLCRLAAGIAPARCAQEVPTSLGVPWHRVAQVCMGATSTTPGRCLAHHIRHSRLILRSLDANLVVRECRIAAAQPTALRIAHASYNCPQLRTMCPLHLVLNVVDQYGDSMAEEYHQQGGGNNVVYVSAVFTGSHGQQFDYIRPQQPGMQGPSYAAIANGSATFSNLVFTGAGEFTLTFRAGEGVTEEVARVLVHPDHAAEALTTRCDELFTRFQCIAHDFQQQNMQLLLLPAALHLSAISCDQYWVDNVGGLSFSGFYPPHNVLFALLRPLYDLFTSNMDIPRADMSAWALLGLDEGETNRTAIRHAYHRRSLEWHPDKWHALSAALPVAWQQELGGAYTLVTQAYDQLTS